MGIRPMILHRRLAEDAERMEKTERATFVQAAAGARNAGWTRVQRLACRADALTGLARNVLAVCPECGHEVARASRS
jgi:hypothetical protein